MTTVWDVILAKTPLALYKCDEASGTTMVDSSGNGRNGTIDGGVQLNQAGILPGAPGGAWLLNAIEGGAVTGASWMAPASAFTAVVFFRLTALPGGTAILMARSDVNGANLPSTKAWSIQTNASGVVTGRVFNNLSSSVAPASASGAVATNTLIMLAVSHDGTTVKFRKNGSSLIASAALGGTPVQFAGNSQPLTLGRDATSSGVGLAGKVEGGAFFGSALSDADLDAIWAAASKYGVEFSGALPVLGGAFDLNITENNSNVELAGSLPALTGAFNVDNFGALVQLDAALPALTGTLAVDQIDDSPWADAVRALGSDVLLWARLADGAGAAELTDASGNNHHGAYHSTWHTAAPLVGEGASVVWDDAGVLDGGHAIIPVDGWLDSGNGPDEFSIFMWCVRPTVQGDLLGRIDDDTTLHAVITDEGLGGVDFRVLTTTGLATVTAPIATGRHFVGITYAQGSVASPGATGYRLYVDGVDVDGVNVTGATPEWGSQPLQLSSPGFPLEQAQDEVVLVDRALTPAEIADLFAAGSAAEAELDGALPALTGTFTAAVELEAQLDGNLPALTGAFNVDRTDNVALTGTLPALTGAFTVDHGDVRLAGGMQALQGHFTLTREESVALAGTLPPLAGAFNLTGSYDVSLAGSLPALTGAFDLTSPLQTDTGNRASGRVRDGHGVLFYEPPVVEPPEFTIASHAFVSVRAYASAAMSGTRPVFGTVVKQQARRALDRVLVGGKDVTYLRDVFTPPPSYTLVAPLLYGPATLDLPQVSAVFEQPGAGDLAWCAKGKKVLVQRVDPDTLEVIATDYKGIVIAHNISGRHLQLQIGGEATGRAALIDKQPPLFFKRNDLGFWWWGGVSELGLPFEPRLGIDTGIVLRNAGGMDHLSYLQDLSAKGTRRNGAQLTCMPRPHESGGAYEVVTKDLETIHATVYLDDALTVPDLRDDLAEQPNRVFATGVTPEGMRVKFGAYPLLRDDTPPPYPMSDDSHFGVGTTDGDTDTGDGVSVMIWRLVKAGFLTLADKPGGYDDDVADAIRDLKEIYLSGTVFIDGDMTPQAWAALFNASATGYSLAGTQILPAAQRSKTRKWNRTANGSVISLNDDFDPSVLPVDATIDGGVGMTRRQLRGFAHGELAPAGGGDYGTDYVGTITLNSGAVIRGEHTPGDPITVDDVMDARELRPGMNLNAPLFAGGRLLHIAGVDRRVDDSGQSTIVLDVDTQARDTMKVWEVIRRNRESRRNPARAWLNQHRSSALTKDAVVEYDEIGGVLDDRVDLPGGHWTVFTDVAAQAGTMRSIRLRTSPPTEFVMAVFCRQITATRLEQLVGNPLTKGGKKRWADPDIREQLDKDHVMVYVAGEKKAPLGYFPGKKFADPLPVDDSPDDEQDAPDLALLTGRWEDEAGFGYETFNAQMLWIALFAADASHVLPGRIMWPQLESGS